MDNKKIHAIRYIKNLSLMTNGTVIKPTILQFRKMVANDYNVSFEEYRHKPIWDVVFDHIAIASGGSCVYDVDTGIIDYYRL